MDISGRRLSASAEQHDSKIRLLELQRHCVHVMELDFPHPNFCALVILAEGDVAGDGVKRVGPQLNRVQFENRSRPFRPEARQSPRSLTANESGYRSQTGRGSVGQLLLIQAAEACNRRLQHCISTYANNGG